MSTHQASHLAATRRFVNRCVTCPISGHKLDAATAHLIIVSIDGSGPFAAGAISPSVTDVQLAARLSNAKVDLVERFNPASIVSEVAR